LRPYLNKHDVASFSGVCSTDILVLNVLAESIPEYVNLYFDQKEFIEFAMANSKGINLPRVSEKEIMEACFPLAPLSEQRRIVDRIESLFAKLDEAKEKAQTVVDGFEDRKAAILHKAFTGELTEKWRSKKGITIDKWFKGTVKDVCKDIKVGIVIKPSQYYAEKEMGTPAFRSANVREFHIDDFDWVYLNKEGMDLNKRSIVHTGDVLIVRSGNPGTACVVEERFDGYNAIDILIAVPDHNRISSEYLCAFTNSPIGKRLVAENKRGMALAHFNVSGYSQLQIAVPSIEEQNEIMKVIIPILQKEEMIKEEAEKLLIGIDSMKKTILAKAFRGELGTNDPAEPPVELF
jgi:restriction endonuclease S subunit